VFGLSTVMLPGIGLIGLWLFWMTVRRVRPLPTSTLICALIALFTGSTSAVITVIFLGMLF
jgi:hypothetical protein